MKSEREEGKKKKTETNGIEKKHWRGKWARNSREGSKVEEKKGLEAKEV